MRRYVWIPLSFVGLAGVFACGDDASSPAGPDGGDEVAAPSRDSGAQPDAAPSDASSPTDGGDGGGPMMSSTQGSTGFIDVFNDFVMGAFYEDDTIVRTSDAPECVVHVRSETKPFSPAGKLTIGGPIVGADGGPPSVIEIQPDPTNFYQYGPGVVFPSPSDLVLQVSATSTPSFPVINVQSLTLPPAAPLVLTKPTLPDAGDLAISVTTPFEIAWTVPGGANTKLRVGVRLNEFNGDGNKTASLYCSFPIAAGAGKVPSALLAEVRKRVGAKATGLVEIHVGSMTEVASGDASYVLRVLRGDTIALQGNGSLQ